MTERYKRYIAKIFNLKNDFVGMGFLIDKRNILTCSHILKNSSENNDFLQNVQIELPFIFGGRRLNANLLENFPKIIDKNQKEMDDFAIIKISEDEEIRFTAYSFGPQISFAEPESLSNHRIEAYGYPSNHPGGKLAFAEISGALDSARLQMHNRQERPGEYIDKGFSGSPIWDENIRKIVGIVVKRSKEEMMAYAIPLKYMADRSQLLRKLIPQSEDIFKSSLNNIKIARGLFVDAGLLIEDDLRRLEVICDIIKQEWKIVRESQDYLSPDIYPFSAYDDIHSIFVEEKIFELIIDNLSYSGSLTLNYILEDANIVARLKEFYAKANLTPKDVFLLLASAWLHDIGMNPKVSLEFDEKIRLPALLKDHHIRSAQYVDKYSNKLELRPYEKGPIKKLCELHRHKEYKELYYTSDNKIALLASYLRLAGALQISQKEETGSFMAVGFRDAFSRFQWLKSQVAIRSTVNRDTFEAIIEVPKIEFPDNDKIHIEILKKLIERELQNELDSTRNIFIRNRLNAYISAKCNFVDFGELDKDRIKEIILNIELFESIISPTSSTIMDIVLEQIYSILLPDNNLQVNEKLERLTYLKSYSKRVLQNIVETRPCHVPLHKVYDYLAYIYFDLELNISNAEKTHNEISSKLKYWDEKKKIIRSDLPKVAYGLLKDKTPILLYGYSRCIVDCIKKAIKCDPSIRKTPIYICEVATKNEYRHNNRLVYNDALKYIKEFKREDLNMENINYVVDASASNLFCEQNVSKVLFGANGIEYEGFIHHTLGHLAIADMASRYNVPVYVIADSFKIGPIIDDYKRVRENQWLTTDIDEEYILEKEGISNYNPRGDRVPPDRISFIVTEKGICSPKDIKYHADDYPQECVYKAYSFYSKWRSEDRENAKDKEIAMKLFAEALKVDPDYSAAKIGSNMTIYPKLCRL